MIYKVVQMVDGWMDERKFSEADLIAFMASCGYPQAGVNANPRQRVELQGRPRFAGVNGPMWDGLKDGVPVIRYEDPAAYRALSA